MGFLKHFIIPFFAVLHFVSFFACFDLNRWGSIMNLPVESTADYNSTRQLHMLGVLRSFHLFSFLLCVLGVVWEHSHFRGVLALLFTIFYGNVMLDAYIVGITNFYVPGIFALVAMIGGLIHMNEPGIFTKDKHKNKST